MAETGVSRYITRMVEQARVYFRRGWKLEDMVADVHLEPSVVRHLRRTLLVLFCVSASLAIGSYLCLTIEDSIAEAGSFVAFLGPFFIQQVFLRAILLVAGAFFDGVLLTSWIADFIGGDDSLLVTPFVAGFIVTSFVGSSLFMVMVSLWLLYVRSYHTWHTIWFHGIFMNVAPVLTLCLVSAPHYLNVGTNIGISLVISLCYWIYVMAYTYELVVKAREGDKDYASHARSFLTALPGVFVHICIQVCLESFEVFRRND